MSELIRGKGVLGMQPDTSYREQAQRQADVLAAMEAIA